MHCGRSSNTGSLTDNKYCRIVFGLVLTAWLVIWLVFIVKELIVKHEVRHYARLLSCAIDGKRAYVTGERLYELLCFASANIPAGATVTMCGIEEGSIDDPRSTYYLYPCLRVGSEGEYCCVYDSSCSDPRYEEWRRLDDRRFIMRRRADAL